MYLTYQDLYTRCQNQASDTNAATLTLFKQWISEGLGKCYEQLNAEYFYNEVVYDTADGTYSYPLPYNCDKIHTIKTTISSRDYIATEFPGDEAQWNALISGASESSYPCYFFVKRNTFEIYPTSSTDSLDMTIKYKVRKKDLSKDNHTTGTILTATNGSTAIVGNALSWTAAMIGRYLKITSDGDWYEIAAVPTASTITLAREYGGTSIAGGTEAYIIGEMSLLPVNFQELPVDYALMMYSGQKKDKQLLSFYLGRWESGLQRLKESGGNLTTSGLLEEEVVLYDPNWNKTLS